MSHPQSIRFISTQFIKTHLLVDNDWHVLEGGPAYLPVIVDYFPMTFILFYKVAHESDDFLKKQLPLGGGAVMQEDKLPGKH